LQVIKRLLPKNWKDLVNKKMNTNNISDYKKLLEDQRKELMWRKKYHTKNLKIIKEKLKITKEELLIIKQ